MIKSRHRHGCGAFALQSKLVIIVAGDRSSSINKKSVEFLSINDIEPKWIAGKKSFFKLLKLWPIFFMFLGPDLPGSYDGDSHKIVSDGETVYYVNTKSNVILRLDCPSDLSSCKWTTLEQKLSFPRSSSLAFLVPDELTECSETVNPNSKKSFTFNSISK